MYQKFIKQITLVNEQSWTQENNIYFVLKNLFPIGHQLKQSVSSPLSLSQKMISKVP